MKRDDQGPVVMEELDLEDLDQAAGGLFGLSWLGGIGQAGIGVGAGPAVGAGIAHGVPQEGSSALYGTTEIGHGYGVTGGAQAGVVVGFGESTFNDVVTGNSHNISFGFGQVSFNSNGFTLGLGPSGVGYSYTNTTQLSNDPHALPGNEPAVPSTGMPGFQPGGPLIDGTPNGTNPWAELYNPVAPPPGTEHTQTFDDGSTLTSHPDGTTTSTEAHADPQPTTQTFDDGSTLTSHPDGTTTATEAHADPQPTTQTFDDGSTLTSHTDGTTTATEAPDYGNNNSDPGGGFDGGGGGGGGEE